MAPATNPAIPAINMLLCVAGEAATPSTRLDVDTIPSFAPNTAARNQPMLFSRCISLRGTVIFAAPFQVSRVDFRSFARGTFPDSPADRTDKRRAADVAETRDRGSALTQLPKANIAPPATQAKARRRKACVCMAIPCKDFCDRRAEPTPGSNAERPRGTVLLCALLQGIMPGVHRAR